VHVFVNACSRRKKKKPLTVLNISCVNACSCMCILAHILKVIVCSYPCFSSVYMHPCICIHKHMHACDYAHTCNNYIHMQLWKMHQPRVLQQQGVLTATSQNSRLRASSSVYAYALSVYVHAHRTPLASRCFSA
jgi:hypothetical protein